MKRCRACIHSSHRGGLLKSVGFNSSPDSALVISPQNVSIYARFDSLLSFFPSHSTGAETLDFVVGHGRARSGGYNIAHYTVKAFRLGDYVYVVEELGHRSLVVL